MCSLLLACVALAAGCGGGDRGSAPTPEDTGGEQVSGCAEAAKPAPKAVQLPKPTARLDPAKSYLARIETSCGTFAIRLDSMRAPKTGGSFRYLARKGFYDGTTFHRIVPGLLIQGGDPAGNGSGGPGYSVSGP